MRVVATRLDARFTGPPDQPLQAVGVTVEGTGPGLVGLHGRGLRAEPVTVDVAPGAGRAEVELAVATDLAPGTDVDAEVWARADGDDGGEDVRPVVVAVARPGTTVHLVPHFHFDPVWWNTQASSVSELARTDWSGSPRMSFQRSAFEILAAHLDRAVADPRYRFCVAEVDYLRPYLDRHPWERARVADLVAAGRIEVVGATFNEPATNLVGVELTRRNLVHGLAYQRGVLGADVATAWQLDEFGHHPSFPSLLAEVGVGASAWARGPHRQWGPMIDGGFAAPHAPVGMQTASEIEWLAPDGTGVLTAHLAAHYSAGWAIDAAPTWDDAATVAVGMGAMLRLVSLTDHVLLLVGTDLSPPPRWAADLPERFAERWCWPRLGLSRPSDFLAAVRASTSPTGPTSGRRPAPVTRDMNPVYTGKDVSYIDTKQAARAAEELLAEAETWATVAEVVGAGDGPDAELDHAWRLLVHGAHHDAITGTESDQVYLDLLAGWRRAHDLAVAVDTGARRAIADATDTRGAGRSVLVFDATESARTDVVGLDLGPDDLAGLAGTADAAVGLRVLDAAGRELPAVAEHVRRDDRGRLIGVRLRVVVDTGAGLGTTGLRVVAGPDLEGWTTTVDDAAASAVVVEGSHHVLTVDPARGGGVTRWWHRPTGRELVPAGDVGAELVLHPEHPTHPVHGEGPWHLSPSGPAARSTDAPARVRVLRSAAGVRVVIHGHVGPLAHRTTLTQWTGVDRLDVEVEVDPTGADHLLRFRWPAAVAGGLPVVDVGEAAIGRGPALIEADAGELPATLDTPAHGWVARSSTARVALRDVDGAALGRRAIGAVEVVLADPERATDAERGLVTALAAAGVTSTPTAAGGPRWGALAHDSSLPDARIVVGLLGRDPVAAAVLSGRPAEAALVADGVAAAGSAAVWVPGRGPRAEVWVAGADLRHPADLPALVVAAATADELANAVAALTVEMRAGATLRAVADPAAVAADGEDDLDDATVAVVVRGTPGVAVTLDGALHVSLLRASTAWPSGEWIDPPRRTTPDGSSFAVQHWSHRAELAIVAGEGDWRAAGVASRARAVHRPLRAVVGPAHEGPLAPGPLVTVTPPTVELVALKPAGYPLVAGRPVGERRRGRVVARLHEPFGRPTTATLGLPSPVAAAHRTDLAEEGDLDPLATIGATVAVELAPLTTRTAAVELHPAPPPASARAAATTVPPADPGPPGPDRPAFSRYWVQSRGPAPLGGLPVSVHLHPPGPGPSGTWVVAVTSARREAVVVSLVHEAPAGWVVDGPSEVTVAPGGHVLAPLVVTAPTGAVGPHVVRTTALVAGRPELAAYDEHVLVDDRTPGGRAVELVGPDRGLVLAPGTTGVLSAALVDRGGLDRRAEVEALSPWGSWDLLPRPVVEVAVVAGSTTPFEVPVVVPATAVAGRWWVLLRAVVGPELRYAAAVPLVVADAPAVR